MTIFHILFSLEPELVIITNIKNAFYFSYYLMMSNLNSKKLVQKCLREYFVKC